MVLVVLATTTGMMVVMTVVDKLQGVGATGVTRTTTAAPKLTAMASDL